MVKREWRSAIIQDVRAIPTVCEKLQEEDFEVFTIFPSVLINPLAPQQTAPITVIVASRPATSSILPAA